MAIFFNFQEDTGGIDVFFIDSARFVYNSGETDNFSLDFAQIVFITSFLFRRFLRLCLCIWILPD